MPIEIEILPKLLEKLGIVGSNGYMYMYIYVHTDNICTYLHSNCPEVICR